VSNSRQQLPILPGVFSLPSIAVSRDEMIAFAEAFDPQPFHMTAAALGDFARRACFSFIMCAKISVRLKWFECGTGRQMLG
jgi:hypothetical protein